MAKKFKRAASPANENSDLQPEQSGDHSNDIKKLELQHLVLNKLLTSNKKTSKPAISGHEIQLKDKNQ
jgi:hypothetical protein